MLLKPIAKFCLRNSINLSVVVDQLKVALVRSAVEDFRRQEEKVNVSRLSVRTGLHRREVTRIYKEKEGGKRDWDKDIIRRVIGYWIASESSLNKDGSPRRLRYKDSESFDFHSLVATISRDVDAKAVLVCLEGLDVVKRDGDYVELLRDSYIIRGDVIRGYELLGRDLEDLFKAVEDNINKASGDIPNLHARTQYDNILKSKLPEIREWILKRGADYHGEVRQYLMQYDSDLHPDLEGEAGGIVSFGTFSVTDSKTEEL